MTPLVRRPIGLIAVLTALLLLASACIGGGGETAEVAPPGPVLGIAPTPTPEPLDGESPDDLPFADKPVVLEGAEVLKVSAGEVLELDYLVYNPTALRERFSIRATSNSELSVPDASSSTVRINSRDVTSLSVSFAVPLNAQVGELIEVDVLVANTGDVSLRDNVTTQLEVVDSDGKRPEAGDDRASTTTNERVTAYVIGNDTDPDGDIVYSSASMVTGGFRAAGASVDSNGTITYVPFANVSGKDMLLYEICDKDGRCDTSIVTITIDESS